MPSMYFTDSLHEIKNEPEYHELVYNDIIKRRNIIINTCDHNYTKIYLIQCHIGTCLLENCSHESLLWFFKASLNNYMSGCGFKPAFDMLKEALRKKGRFMDEKETLSNTLRHHTCVENCDCFGRYGNEKSARDWEKIGDDSSDNDSSDYALEGVHLHRGEIEKCFMLLLQRAQSAILYWMLISKHHLMRSLNLPRWTLPRDLALKIGKFVWDSHNDFNVWLVTNTHIQYFQGHTLWESNI
jgi:hypothetical protein